ncbi:MAG: PKD domain-containing protein [bacterium]|nr:PKD domain-containing protein [bacterium]
MSLNFKKAVLFFSVSFFLTFPAFAEVVQFKFVSEPQNVPAGEVSKQITIQAQNSSGDSEGISQTACVYLSTSSLSGQFSSSQADWVSTNVLTVNKTWANRNFYYKDTSSGSHEIKAVIAFRPESESRSCVGWPVEEWGVNYRISQTILIGEVTGEAGVENFVSSAPEGTATENEKSGVLSTPSVSRVRAFIDAPEVGTARGSVFFDGKAFDEKNELLKTADYYWSFGDGATAMGENVSHIYREPGKYAVSLRVEKDGESSLARATVKVVAGNFHISQIKEGPNGYIEIRNDNTHELDMSLWRIENGGRFFSFPRNTVILGSTAVSFPASVTQIVASSFSSAPRLLFPDGKVAAEYSFESKKETEDVLKNQPTEKDSSPAVTSSVQDGQDEDASVVPETFFAGTEDNPPKEDARNEKLAVNENDREEGLVETDRSESEELKQVHNLASVSSAYGDERKDSRLPAKWLWGAFLFSVLGIVASASVGRLATLSQRSTILEDEESFPVSDNKQSDLNADDFTVIR